MKFEYLPNEILFMCFEFFDALELFHLFDNLNNRFNQLIRQIPLYVNFQSVRKSTFDQFCTKILLDENIKNQIYSLHLSNKETTGQINVFSSWFSLVEFPHLRSLTLTEVRKEDVEKLKSMVLLMSQLRHFRSIDSVNGLLDTIVLSKIHTLSVSELDFLHKTSFMVHLTVQFCSIDTLVEHFFSYLPFLKYFHVQFLNRWNYSIENKVYSKAIHIKQIIIDYYSDELEYLERFFKHTPNLKCLHIFSDRASMLNAYHWEQLITLLLPSLKIFRFHFSTNIDDNADNLIEVFNQFQTDFWLKQHQWPTEYVLKPNSMDIYTVPYMLKTEYRLEMVIADGFPRTVNAFDHIRSLLLSFETLSNECQFYFANIRSLTLFSIGPTQPFTTDHAQGLKRLVNLSNLKELIISQQCIVKTSAVLLQIIKETSHLSVLLINGNKLISFLNDKELCEILHRQITDLCMDTIYFQKYPLTHSQTLHRFCKIFSNLEHLQCRIGRPHELTYILEHLTKLSRFQAVIELKKLGQYESELRKYNIIYNLSYDGLEEDRYQTILDIWIA